MTPNYPSNVLCSGNMSHRCAVAEWPKLFKLKKLKCPQMMFSSMPSMMVKVTAILTYWVLILYCFDITYALCSMVAYGKNGSYFWFLCWNTLQIRQSDCFSLTWQFHCFSKACHDNISITHYTIKQQCCLCLCYVMFPSVHYVYVHSTWYRPESEWARLWIM